MTMDITNEYESNIILPIIIFKNKKGDGTYIWQKNTIWS
jgi:hypothetical protein